MRFARIGPGQEREAVKSIGKIICFGLNYRDHARETHAAEPAEPIMFIKAPDAVTGPHDDVLIPRNPSTRWCCQQTLAQA
jgi:2-keto-4-pentenoate hydratase/2-oxohepta-3-ene-1,7-dioic acid hydratase in catechol pathway